MITEERLRAALRGSAWAALLAVGWTLGRRSEASSAVFFGYSTLRIALAGGLVLAAVLIFRLTRKSACLSAGLTGFFAVHERVYRALLLLSAALGVLLWSFLFSWLFVPANLRPALLWLIWTVGLAIALLRVGYRGVFRSESFRSHFRIFPRWEAIAPVQKKTMGILLILSLLYLAILIPSNLNGTADLEAFSRYGGDEFVIYPVLMDVMKPGETFGATLYHLFIYEDYHYGYPFYAVSTLLLTPVRLLTGAAFPDRVDLNLPILRMGVSVVPLVLAAWAIVYLFTRFRCPLVSALTLVFLLFAPGSLQNNQGFWHPDGLNLLFVCLSLVFIRRDDERFGRNFYAAAVCVGLSIATRLYGFFFAPAIAVYLTGAVLRKKATWLRAVRAGTIFILVMTLTVALSSPYLFRADARGRMIEILSEKSGEMAHGYEGDFDPRNDYRPGWAAWRPAFEDHYVRMFCFAFLWGSLLTGAFLGSERLTYRTVALWSLTITAYLVFFVAVKSTQYVLPALLPLMGAIFALPLTIEDAGIFSKRTRTVAWLASGAVFAAQLVLNLIRIRPRFF